MEIESPRGLEKTIESLEDEILEKKKKLAELRRSLPRQEVQDYVLMGSDGSQARLSEMFGPQ